MDKPRACGFDGCLRAYYAGGYCKPHYRAAQDGTPLSDVRHMPYRSLDRWERECNSCGEVKSLDEFNKASTTTAFAGRVSVCRGCRAARFAALSADRKIELAVRKHGLSLEDYKRLLAEQGGKCKICERGATGFAVHDHACCPGAYSCGKCVRGLLCASCNMALGGFGESVEVMRKAIIYVGG